MLGVCWNFYSFFRSIFLAILVEDKHSSWHSPQSVCFNHHQQHQQHLQNKSSISSSSALTIDYSQLSSSSSLNSRSTVTNTTTAGGHFTTTSGNNTDNSHFNSFMHQQQNTTSSSHHHHHHTQSRHHHQHAYTGSGGGGRSYRDSSGGGAGGGGFNQQGQHVGSRGVHPWDFLPNERIQNVWSYNLEEEMEKIRDVVENFRFISMVIETFVKNIFFHFHFNVDFPGKILFFPNFPTSKQFLNQVISPFFELLTL